MFRGTTMIAGLLTAALATGVAAQQTGQQHQEQDQQRQAEQRQQQDQDRQRDQQMVSLHGRVHEVRHERHLGEEHVHLYVRTEDDRTHKVDLGPRRDVEEVERQLNRGDEVSILAERKELEGEQTFVAHRIVIAEETFNIDRWAQEHERDAQPARLREDQQRQERTYYGDEPQREDRQAEWRIGQEGQPLREQHFEDRDARRQQDRSRDERAEQRFQQDRWRDDARQVRFDDQRTEGATFHFKRAVQTMEQQNHRVAAEETRMAAKHIEMQASRATGSERDDLNIAANDLNQLADRIGRGEVQERQLKQEFASAAHALARHHQRQADTVLQDQRVVPAGYDLKAAAHYLELSAQFEDRRPDQEQQQAIQEIERVANRLIEGPEDGQAVQVGFQQDAERDREQLRTPERDREQPGERADGVRDEQLRQRDGERIEGQVQLSREDEQLVQEAQQASQRLERALQQADPQREPQDRQVDRDARQPQQQRIQQQIEQAMTRAGVDQQRAQEESRRLAREFTQDRPDRQELEQRIQQAMTQAGVDQQRAEQESRQLAQQLEQQLQQQRQPGQQMDQQQPSQERQEQQPQQQQPQGQQQ